MNYQGWRRPRGSAANWQKVEGALSPNAGTCFNLCMELSELVSGSGQWEYEIQPETERPRDNREQSYKTRILRPET